MLILIVFWMLLVRIRTVVNHNKLGHSTIAPRWAMNFVVKFSGGDLVWGSGRCASLFWFRKVSRFSINNLIFWDGSINVIFARCFFVSTESSFLIWKSIILNDFCRIFLAGALVPYLEIDHFWCVKRSFPIWESIILPACWTPERMARARSLFGIPPFLMR